ncbi:hypothetical protein PENSPDRAFT_598627 [Peniophora sp. CONT]|nr:hypothetical protein PENSPDRAFT_598627 [Peniophora sp. CONT]
MAEVDVEKMQLDGQQLYTCLSCTIAFLSAEEQRLHYRSDHHRYNMKRRVANLPPVSAVLFNQKVLERRQETAVMLSPKGSTCDVCNKSYTTENAFRSHVQSKKHKENEIKALSKPKPATPAEEADPDTVPSAEPIASTSTALDVIEETAAPTANGISLAMDVDATEEEVNMTIDQKIAAARSGLTTSHCLFCSTISSSLEDNLTHMSSTHSFFVPDAEFLVDLPGLLTYLGEKVAVGNICLYCNGKGREFRTLDAVRKHMVDKSHCKIAYSTESEMMEIVDYYDFSASYPDAEERAAKKAARDERRRLREERRAAKAQEEAEEGWEEDEEMDDAEADEVIEEEASASGDSDSESESESEDEEPERQITFGDTHYELVLPNGKRLIHRDMQRYFKQRISLAPRRAGEDPNSGQALVRRLLADKNSALVPRKGGFGAFGQGTEVIKARNRGEAREAGRHVREFRDQKRRENFKTLVGFRGNNQKHFRDPLLQ